MVKFLVEEKNLQIGIKCYREIDWAAQYGQTHVLAYFLEKNAEQLKTRNLEIQERNERRRRENER